MSDEALVRHVVASDEAGERFDKVVAQLLGVGRARARALVDAGAARLDGAVAAGATRVPPGATVSVRWTEQDDRLPPRPVRYSVAVEDERFVVVDKPAGVVVHPGAGHEADTLVNGLVAAYPELDDLGREHNWGLVHRLDRDTSGLLVVARDLRARAFLQEELRARRVTRRYWALASGRRFDNATGTVDAPIARDPRRPTHMAVTQGGRPSRTHYERIATWPTFTLLEVTLETGRTHQIRVHLSAISAPLVGDRGYGGPPSGLEPERVWLHAHRLDFPHPETGATVTADSVLPPELLEVLETLGPPEAGDPGAVVGFGA